MKKIFLPFVFVCSLSTSFSQGLEFNRSIDTLIYMNTITAGTVFNPYQTISLMDDSLSPPNGKVWKVQSIVQSSENKPSNTVLLYFGSSTSFTTMDNTQLKIKLKNNQIDLTKQSLQSIYVNPYYVSNLPLWINSNSNIYIGIEFENPQTVQNELDYSGIKVWFSILEFNEN